MDGILQFNNRAEFRKWLYTNCLTNDGVWLLFDKSKKPNTITATEALEEALCCRAKSKWSEKNKALVRSLEERGLMTEFGIKKIEEAKQNGQWNAPKPAAVTDEQIAYLSDILKEYKPAYTNFQAMPPSVKKTYTKAYLDAKTETGRQKRIAWIINRLNKNLKPM